MVAGQKHAVFSDIDGTLVHYPVDLSKEDNSLLIHLPPSKTGTRGVISRKTLYLCQKLRSVNNGTPLILVSGMRTTTLFQRMPYLPTADAYVCESGGRIFYPQPLKGIGEEYTDDDIVNLVKNLISQPTTYIGTTADGKPLKIIEDMEWRRRTLEVVKTETGKLWEFATTLRKRGYVLDTTGYTTAFRINRKHQKSQLASSFDDFIEKCSNKDGIPNGLDCSTNLGCVDIYPAVSGKKNCAEYLVNKLLGNEETTNEDDRDTTQQQQSVKLDTHAYCLCDDDNDIEMALACKFAYLPSVTSESIRNLAKKTSKLIITEDTENDIVQTLSTEAALEAVIKELEPIDEHST